MLRACTHRICGLPTTLPIFFLLKSTDVEGYLQQLFVGSVPGLCDLNRSYLARRGGVLLVAGVHVPAGEVEDFEPGDIRRQGEEVVDGVAPPLLGFYPIQFKNLYRGVLPYLGDDELLHLGDLLVRGLPVELCR